MKTSRLILTLAGLGVLLTGGVLAAEKTAETSAPIKELEPAGRDAWRAYHEKALSIYDEDKNGRLDEDERAVLKADIDAGKMEPLPKRPGGGRGPGPHRGAPPEILEKYDANGDGRLSRRERARIRADIKSGKLQRPERPADFGPEDPPPSSEDETEG